MTSLERSPYQKLLHDADFRRWFENIRRGSVTTAHEWLRRMGFIQKTFGKEPISKTREIENYKTSEFYLAFFRIFVRTLFSTAFNSTIDRLKHLYKTQLFKPIPMAKPAKLEPVKLQELSQPISQPHAKLAHTVSKPT